MKFNKEYISTLSVLLIFMAPSKVVSFGFLFLWLTYNLLVNKKNLVTTFLIIIFIFLNTAYSILTNGGAFLINAVLLFFFLSPFFIFFTSKPQQTKSIKNKNEIRKALEHFLIIQIAFSIVAVMYRYTVYRSFDLDFGDVVAGTLRMPLTYSPDASNVIFALTMVLVIFLYTCCFDNVNKKIVASSIFVIFLASVNHIILAFGASYLVMVLFSRPQKIIQNIMILALLTTLGVYLYSILQPLNYMLIKGRFSAIYLAFTTEQGVAELGFKGQFIYTFFTDFAKDTFQYLTIGNGAGTYSSRAALFLTGEYVNFIKFENISSQMLHNTYPLWVAMKNAPPWLSGAFNFPYSSVFSLISELGTLFALAFFVLFYRSLTIFNAVSFEKRLCLFVFLILIGFVDNYFEYFQAFSIFFFIYMKLAKLNNKQKLME